MDKIAKALGGERRGLVTAKGGQFGALNLAADIAERFKAPQTGGRPTDPRWTERRQLPLLPETLELLEKLAVTIRERGGGEVHPMQLAALLLEMAVGDVPAPVSPGVGPPAESERFTRADAVRIVEHVRDRLEKGWAPSAAIGLIVHALRTYPASADALDATTERERCPTCDRPAAMRGDALDSGACWRFAVRICLPPAPPIDWRQRCLAAEAQLAGGDVRPLVEAPVSPLGCAHGRFNCEVCAWVGGHPREVLHYGAPQATPDKDKETDHGA